MLEKLPVAVGQVLRATRPGLGKLAYNDAGLAPLAERLLVQSTAFGPGELIPPIYTADGDGLSPPLSWSGVPDDARALVLLVEDADSPTPQPLVHAIALDLAPDEGGLTVGVLSRGSPEFKLGRNSFMQRRYLPPDPPPGHGVHRYAFQLFACDRALGFTAAPGRRKLLDALRVHALVKGCLIGCYERARPR
jgi:Raf kinase inhibitor-like YbhB/YbcL family protein